MHDHIKNFSNLSLSLSLMFSFFLSPTFPCLPYILKKLRGMSFGSRSFMQVVSDITLLSDFGPGFIPLSYQADTIFFLLAHTQHNLFFKQFPCDDVVLLNKSSGNWRPKKDCKKKGYAGLIGYCISFQVVMTRNFKFLHFIYSLFCSFSYK